MPFDTNGEVWSSAEADSSLQSDVLDFLRENRTKAFNRREISDDVSDTDWETQHEMERMRQEVGEDEFFRRKQDGELSEAFESEYGNSIGYSLATLRLSAVMDPLVEKGIIEQSSIDAAETDVPDDDIEKVAYFTYSG